MSYHSLAHAVLPYSSTRRCPPVARCLRRAPRPRLRYFTTLLLLVPRPVPPSSFKLSLPHLRRRTASHPSTLHLHLSAFFISISISISIFNSASCAVASRISHSPGRFSFPATHPATAPSPGRLVAKSSIVNLPGPPISPLASRIRGPCPDGVGMCFWGVEHAPLEGRGHDGSCTLYSTKYTSRGNRDRPFAKSKLDCRAPLCVLSTCGRASH
ncbi:hypothetical protein C8Q80DRAFT_1184852 [Daedaleopsis nitida]|nr:hypothetical protein C8Q80DRAFT_1184852 [Daedaleopsis nitida]